MLKITPVKQQTGGRFYPGDLARPGSFGAEGRAQEQFARAVQGAANTLAKAWNEKNQLDRNAGRILAKSESTKALQDAFATALKKSNIDGSDLVDTFDVLAAPILSASKYDVDDTEKKYLIGMIGETANRIRTQAHKEQLKRQLQHTEIKVTDTKESSLADIDGPDGLVKHIENGTNLEQGVSKNSFLGQAINKIKPHWVFDGVKKVIETGVEKIKNEIRDEPDTEISADRWKQLHMYRKMRIDLKDLSPEENKRVKDYFLRGNQKSFTEKDGKITDGRWYAYLRDRVDRGLAVGYVDIQILANDGKMPDEVMHLGLDKQGADMAEALKKYIDGSKDAAGNLAATLQQREVTKVTRAGTKIKSQVTAILMEKAINNPGTAKVWAEELLAGKIPQPKDKQGNVLTNNPFNVLGKDDLEDYGGNKPLVSQQVYSAIVGRKVGKDKANMATVASSLLNKYVKAANNPKGKLLDPTGKVLDGTTNMESFEKELDSGDTIRALPATAWRPMDALRRGLKTSSKMTAEQRMLYKAFLDASLRDFNTKDPDGFTKFLTGALKFKQVLMAAKAPSAKDDQNTEDVVNELSKVADAGKQAAMKIKFERYDKAFEKAFEGVPARGIHTHTTNEGKQYATKKDNRAWTTMHMLLNDPKQMDELDETGAVVLKSDILSAASTVRRGLRNHWQKEWKAGRIDEATKNKKYEHAQEMYNEILAFTNILIRRVKSRPKQTRKPQSVGTPVPQGIPPYYLQRINR